MAIPANTKLREMTPINQCWSMWMCEYSKSSPKKVVVMGNPIKEMAQSRKANAKILCSIA